MALFRKSRPLAGKTVARDNVARLKLMGGLLRLNALHPEGFSAYDLANHAGVEDETARAFLNADKGPGYAEVISGRQAPPRKDKGGGGRPANLYRLSGERQPELIKEVAALRGSLAPPDDAASASTIDFFASLNLLDATLEELELRPGTAAEWHRRVAEARLEVEGGVADLESLTSRELPMASEFANRLGKLRGRLASIERAGPRPRVDLLNRLVERFGSWLGGEPQTLEPVMILLDGIEGYTQFVPRLVESYRNALVRVAVFDVSSMSSHTRQQLFASLDCLRSATPLAVSDLILALDGKQQHAHHLATEVRLLCDLGQWQRCVPIEILDIPDFSIGELRDYYVAQSTELLGASISGGAIGGRNAIFAKRLTSALSALSAADTAKAPPHLPFERPDEERRRYLDAAHNLMGKIVCFDATPTQAMRSQFWGSDVSYMPNAGELTYDSQA